MKKTLLFVMILGLFFALASAPAFADESKIQEEAQKFVLEWLTLVDNGRYAETWDDMAGVFKGTITKENWVHDLTEYRKPFGKLVKREGKYITKSSDPSLGDYFIYQYISAFEKKGKVSEAVSIIRDEKGKWTVLGYTIF